MPEPLFSEPSPDLLPSALYKLRWARDGEFSVYLKPGECGAVLDALDPPKLCEICGGSEDVHHWGWHDEGRDMLTCALHKSPFDDVVVSSVQTGVDAVRGPH